MMASIPNMRSTPLPIPAGKTGTADSAPGDFAAQMPVPAAPGQCAEAPPIQLVPTALVMPAPVTAEDGEDETGDASEAKAETSKDGQPVPDVVIPFLPIQPATGPQVLAEGSIPLPDGDTPIPASGSKPALPAVDPRTGKPALPVPATGDPATEQAEAPADTSRVEAAVKELLQRKQVSTRQIAAAPKGTPAESAKADHAPVQAATPAPVQTAAPVTAPLPAIDQAQPALSPATQPASIKADAPANVGGTRTADLAVERQLDLARDNAWLDRLARDIARSASNDTPLRFRLHPQTLGHLQVELQQSDRGTAVRLTVETEAARQILADAQPRLTAEARAQGVRIAETHVDLSGSGRHAPGDQRRQDEARQTPFVRTAHGAGEDVVASARSIRRDRLDRYA